MPNLWGLVTCLIFFLVTCLLIITLLLQHLERNGTFGKSDIHVSVYNGKTRFNYVSRPSSFPSAWGARRLCDLLPRYLSPHHYPSSSSTPGEKWHIWKERIHVSVYNGKTRFNYVSRPSSFFSAKPWGIPPCLYKLLPCSLSPYHCPLERDHLFSFELQPFLLRVHREDLAIHGPLCQSNDQFWD